MGRLDGLPFRQACAQRTRERRGKPRRRKRRQALSITHKAPAINSEFSHCTSTSYVSCEGMPSDVSKESLHARGWAAHEFATAELGDKRLVKRLERIATDFAEHPGAAIPQACGDAHQAKAAYRFFDNDAFEPGQILAAHTRATSQRMRAHAVVLAVQDTTYLNYSNRPATEGLGPIGNNLDKTKGLILHSTLALTPKGEPLGVIDARIQARSKEHFGRTGNQRNRTPLAEKESIKWLESYAACEALAAQCPGITVVSLGDREMDLYELYVARHQARGAWPVELLVRSQHNRQLADSEQLLWDRVQEQPVCARIEVKMPARDGQPARVAQVAIRFAPVTLQPPDLKSEQPPLPVWIVQASEEHPPENAKPLLWRLLTTVPVLCPEDAICRVRWYAQRWQIEVMHKVLKSGCRIEERQLESAARLKRALMVDLVVAW
ncbi:MAG: IS4 family transposase, partial [Opitutaceae bacterium]